MNRKLLSLSFAGVVASDAARTTATDIEAHLKGLMSAS